MSRILRLLLAATVAHASAMAATPAAPAANVVVDKAEPENVQARFFERVQAGELANALAHRGQAVHVRPGTYRMRVPCDHGKPDFNDVSVTVKEGSTTRLRLVDCGVEIRVKTVFH